MIKEEFYQCIGEFFTHGRLLKQINHTFIALIPKVENPSQTQQFRPISLCSTVYKTISKILVNRIRPLLNKIVSLVQSAFVPDWSIHDNILVTHEIVHKFKVLKGKAAWVVLKLDMEKAYDRLEWDFIQACLQQFRFHETRIKWIMECITTVSYSIVINDEPAGLIRPSRGTRQGDPLSPYILIMCMEVLSTALLNVTWQPRTGISIKISTGMDRTHAYYLLMIVFYSVKRTKLTAGS